MTRTEVTGWLAAVGVAAIGGAVLLGTDPPPQTRASDRIVEAACFDERIAEREKEAETAKGLTLIMARGELDNLRLARKLIPTGQYAERKINGRCYYRLPGEQSAALEDSGVVRPATDPAALKAMCCTCAAPGPCKMVGQCAGVRCN